MYSLKTEERTFVLTNYGVTKRIKLPYFALSSYEGLTRLPQFPFESSVGELVRLG